MTQKLRAILVGLVVSLLSQTTFAQYATNTSLLANTEQTTPLRDGQRAMNISRTIMFTGASIAMMGLTTGTVNTILGISGDDRRVRAQPPHPCSSPAECLQHTGQRSLVRGGSPREPPQRYVISVS